MRDAAPRHRQHAPGRGHVMMCLCVGKETTTQRAHLPPRAPHTHNRILFVHVFLLFHSFFALFGRGLNAGAGARVGNPDAPLKIRPSPPNSFSPVVPPPFFHSCSFESVSPIFWARGVLPARPVVPTNNEKCALRLNMSSFCGNKKKAAPPLSHFFWPPCGDGAGGGSAAVRPWGDAPAAPRGATPPRPASACRTARPAATADASPTASAAL